MKSILFKVGKNAKKCFKAEIWNYFLGLNMEIRAQLVNQPKRFPRQGKDLMGLPWGKANSIIFCSLTVRTQKLGGIMNWLKPVIAIQWGKPFIMKMAIFLHSRLHRKDTNKGRTQGHDENLREVHLLREYRTSLSEELGLHPVMFCFLI